MAAGASSPPDRSQHCKPVPICRILLPLPSQELTSCTTGISIPPLFPGPGLHCVGQGGTLELIMGKKLYCLLVWPLDADHILYMQSYTLTRPPTIKRVIEDPDLEPSPRRMSLAWGIPSCACQRLVWGRGQFRVFRVVLRAFPKQILSQELQHSTF